MSLHRFGAAAAAEPVGASVTAAGTAVAIGVFDGVHRGHQALLARARADARAQGAGCLAVALTFDPHPAAVLAPTGAPPAIEPVSRRLQRLAAFGLDGAWVQPFDATFAALQPGAFVLEVLVRGLSARAVTVGRAFRFGQGGAGTAATLAALGRAHGFAVHAEPELTHGGAVISSTEIRRRVAAGDVAGAAAMLGRPFALAGPVEQGAQRGRTLGFPTANLQPPVGALQPATGVYAGYASWAGGPRLPAVINCGHAPTFARGTRRVEVHVLDYAGPAFYGADLDVQLVAQLRDERRFDGVAALRDQIRADVAAARMALRAPSAAATP